MSEEPADPVDGDDVPDDVAERARALADELADGRTLLLDDDERVRLSFTRIDTLTTCARKFRYAYVDRLPSLPSPTLSFGTSIHAVLEWLHDRKTTVVPDEAELLGALYDRWDASGYVDEPRQKQLDDYEQARVVLRSYRERLLREGLRVPVGTEVPFRFAVGDGVLVGSIDRIDADADGALHVVDYKTSRRAKTRRQVAGSLQLAIYALACQELYGRLPATVTLDFVLVGLPVAVDVADLDLDAARRSVADAVAAVRSGLATDAWAPTPNRLCDWCDFRAICPSYQGEGPDVHGAAVRELDRLRRSIVRDAERLRALEAAVERLGSELER